MFQTTNQIPGPVLFHTIPYSRVYLTKSVLLHLSQHFPACSKGCKDRGCTWFQPTGTRSVFQKLTGDILLDADQRWRDTSKCGDCDGT